MRPRTQYAKSGDVWIAYQVTGRGSIDLLIAPGFISHLDHAWEQPELARYLHELGSFSRLICFDKRGTGLSDRTVGIPHLEERIDDIRAVLDAADSKQAALMGFSEGGAMAILFAATHPERVSALILDGAYMYAPTDCPSLKNSGNPDWENATPQDWGTGKTLRRFAPSLANDPHMLEWWATLERISVSPTALLKLYQMNADVDIRHVLPALKVSTLILHRREDRIVLFRAAEALAERIPGAKLVELPGPDHLGWIGEGGRRGMAEIRKFLLGNTSVQDSDRVIATVMFTDIVDSTKQAAAMGDTDWRNLLDTSRTLVRNQLVRFRGREIETTGDGFLATFDGPARAIRCAHEIVRTSKGIGISVRTGLHTGEVELSQDEVRGIAVHMAARVSQTAGPDEVLVSNTVKDLVAGSGLTFESLGTRSFKGFSEPAAIFRANAPA
jgi:pimeloyl-ACP methyl ester carboxylesterase